MLGNEINFGPQKKAPQDIQRIGMEADTETWYDRNLQNNFNYTKRTLMR